MQAPVVKIKCVSPCRKSENPVMTLHIDDHALNRVTCSLPGFCDERSPITIPELRVVDAWRRVECEGRPRWYEISSVRSRLQPCCCRPRQRLLRRRMESGMWRVTGTATASCPATAPPSGSNGKRRGIAGQSTGTAAPAFIEGAGTAAASARAGPKPRSGTYGTAADNGSRPIRTHAPLSRQERGGRGVVRGGLPASQALADLDAAYSPAVARLDALRLANT